MARPRIRGSPSAPEHCGWQAHPRSHDARRRNAARAAADLPRAGFEKASDAEIATSAAGPRLGWCTGGASKQEEYYSKEYYPWKQPEEKMKEAEIRSTEADEKIQEAVLKLELAPGRGGFEESRGAHAAGRGEV